MWDAERYAANARFVADLAADLIDQMAVKPGERILDLGCGDGVLTEKLAAAGATVIGVDTAPGLLAAAKARGLDVRFVDGETLPFQNEFDVVFSNAALHWMKHADGVITGVRRALKPGGRFIGEFGGHGNVAAIRVALMAVLARRGAPAIDPWYFPTADEYREKLEAGGFEVLSTRLIPRPTALPSDMAGWLDLFTDVFFTPLPPEDREAARDEVISLLKPVLRDKHGRWTADYVRLRFMARAV
ncbi:MAG: class I SAM-dependent methyltransferase [Nitrospiraceae bacterium]